MSFKLDKINSYISSLENNKSDENNLNITEKNKIQLYISSMLDRVMFLTYRIEYLEKCNKDIIKNIN